MITPSNEWPQHRNTQLANTTQLWYGSDSKESFDKNLLDPISRAWVVDAGWVENEITYKFNKQGFRSIEFDTDISAGMALGCSFTQGVGVLQEHSWPSIVSKKIQYPIWNLGIGAGSMDTVFRLLDYWLPILKPKFVLVACPSKYRIEICNSDGTFNNFLPAHTPHGEQLALYKEWIMHEANSDLNFKKNLLAIASLCNQHSIPLHELSVDKDFISDHKARDLIHPGAQSHCDFADKMIQKLERIT
jgi:hypothetical protein